MWKKLLAIAAASYLAACGSPDDSLTPTTVDADPPDVAAAAQVQRAARGGLVNAMPMPDYQAADAGLPDASQSVPMPPMASPDAALPPAADDDYWTDLATNPCHESKQKIDNAPSGRVNAYTFSVWRPCNAGGAGPALFYFPTTLEYPPDGPEWFDPYLRAIRQGEVDPLPTTDRVIFAGGLEILSNNCSVDTNFERGQRCMIYTNATSGRLFACLRTFRTTAGPRPGGSWEPCASVEVRQP